MPWTTVIHLAHKALHAGRYLQPMVLLLMKNSVWGAITVHCDPELL